jgi:hypothetical protein
MRGGRRSWLVVCAAVVAVAGCSASRGGKDAASDTTAAVESPSRDAGTQRLCDAAQRADEGAQQLLESGEMNQDIAARQLELYGWVHNYALYEAEDPELAKLGRDVESGQVGDLLEACRAKGYL